MHSIPHEASHRTDRRTDARVPWNAQNRIKRAFSGRCSATRPQASGSDLKIHEAIAGQALSRSGIGDPLQAYWECHHERWNPDSLTCD